MKYLYIILYVIPIIFFSISAHFLDTKMYWGIVFMILGFKSSHELENKK